MENKKRLIYADDAMKWIRESKVPETGAFTKGINKGLNIALSTLGNNEVLPTAEAVEVVHGEWIMVIDENDCECIECPLCGEQFYDGDNDTFDKPYNYCPNCGADMRGDGNG